MTTVKNYLKMFGINDDIERRSNAISTFMTRQGFKENIGISNERIFQNLNHIS